MVGITRSKAINVFSLENLGNYIRVATIKYEETCTLMMILWSPRRTMVDIGEWGISCKASCRYIVERYITSRWIAWVYQLELECSPYLLLSKIATEPPFCCNHFTLTSSCILKMCLVLRQVIILDEDLPSFHHCHDKLDMIDESEELPFEFLACKTSKKMRKEKQDWEWNGLHSRFKVSRMLQQHLNCWSYQNIRPQNSMWKPKMKVPKKEFPFPGTYLFASSMLNFWGCNFTYKIYIYLRD